MSFADVSIGHSKRRHPKKRLIIFTEDEKSSKTYLEDLVSHGDGTVSLKVVGKGKHTVDLVKEARSTLPAHEKKLTETLKRVLTPYHRCCAKHGKKSFRYRFDEVWVVFDKDDFDDFDAAVMLAEQYKYKEAWSNPCFELWYMLYLKDVDAKPPLHRDSVFDFLTEKLGTRKRFGKKYRRLKGESGAQLHKEMAMDKEGIKAAISRAVRLTGKPIFKGKKPSESNPYTLFHTLMSSMQD